MRYLRLALIGALLALFTQMLAQPAHALTIQDLEQRLITLESQNAELREEVERLSRSQTLAESGALASHSISVEQQSPGVASLATPEPANDPVDFYIGPAVFGAVSTGANVGVVSENAPGDEPIRAEGLYAGGIAGVRFHGGDRMFLGLEGVLTTGLSENSSRETETFFFGGTSESLDTLEEEIAAEAVFRSGFIWGDWSIFGKAGAGASVIHHTHETRFDGQQEEWADEKDLAPTALIGIGAEYDFASYFLRAEGDFRHIFLDWEAGLSQYRLGSAAGVRF